MTLKEYIAIHSSLPQFGEKIGVSESGVRKWMYGQREPDIDTALRIEEITGGKVTVGELSRQAVAASLEADRLARQRTPAAA